MTWTHDDPAQGSPAAIQGMAKLRSSRATKIRDAQQALRAAASGSGAEWKAMSQTAFAAKLSKDAADIELLAAGLEAQAAALQTYAGQLSQLKDRQRVLEQQRSSAQMAVGLARVKLLTAGAAEPTAMKAELPDTDAVAASRRETAAAQTVVDDADARLRAVDAQWRQLVKDRSSIDSTCAAALQAETALGGLAGLSSARIAGTSPSALLDLISSMSENDLKILLTRHPELAKALEKANPDQVARWWGALSSSQHEALTVGLPSIVGALDGVPALSRVAANKMNAQERIDTLEKAIAHWQKLAENAGTPHRFDERIAELNKELKYLERATGADPTVRLYLYDRGRDRIVEMIGTPSDETKNVITYVPGTFAAMDDFFGGEVQKVAKYLQQQGGAGTVAFVYKDGNFPQSIPQANDQEFALAAGRQLNRFTAGLSAQPLLDHVQQVGMGHSWGLANVTAAEESGTHWGKVLSLSGAGVPTAWERAPHTRYADFSYEDVLQDAQHLPGNPVWSGRNPRDVGFEHGDYYPPPAALQNHPLNGIVESVRNGLGLHNLIAGTSADNRAALRDMKSFIEEQ
ncbi:hypothetical protein BIU98_04720 [Curtobacterium sp. MMLR14_010]|nr:hypothetical protein BIU98_04720 [Curtobacterium sp. MMLR14_010]